MHRDLKPANIVLNENWQIKITDFGTAKQMFSSNVSGNSSSSNISYISGMSNISAISGISGFGSKSANVSANSIEKVNPMKLDDELVGSEYYISPEMLENRSYSYSSDLWALGIMLFQFLVGKTPFRGKC